MRIWLICDNLMTRTQLAGSWSNAGMEVVSADAPQVTTTVVDLGAAHALETIRSLRARDPEREIIAFGPHVDAEAFQAARQAGSSRALARGKIRDYLLARMG